MDAWNGESSAGSAEEQRLRLLTHLEAKLRWDESLWTAKKRPIRSHVAALHDPALVDLGLVACFLIPSLPQLSTDYLELARMMHPSQPLYAIYLPSELRTPDIALSVHKLATYYADEIEKLQPSGPLALCGWSAGGVVARLVALLLITRGRDVSLLVAIDAALPTVDAGTRGMLASLQLLYHRASNIVASFVLLGRPIMQRLLDRSNSTPPSLRQVARTAWNQSDLKAIWKRLVVRIVAGTRNSSSADSQGQLHPAEAASSISQMQPDHRACAMALYDAIFAYPLDEDYPGEVVIYEATAEPARSSERVAAKWQRVCRRATVVPVRGSHNSIIKQPDGVALARDLSSRLAQIAARYRSNMGSIPA